jgi:hypothetical protein
MLASMTVMTALAGALPTAGEAATSNVTISYGNWNCRLGGAVTGLAGVSIDRGGPGTMWGTNRITLWSQLGVRVQISARIFCSRAW